MGVAVKATIRQTQHASREARQQRFANRPFALSVSTQIGGEDGVTGALNQDGALGLRIACMTGAAARVAKDFDVIRLVGDFQVAAVYGNQA